MTNNVENALYIRSENYFKGTLNLQRLVGENYAKQNSMSISIIEDTKISGVTPANERPGLRWLLHLIEVGLIKTVLVSCLSRISRDVKELHYIQSLFEKNNAELIVINKSELSSK